MATDIVGITGSTFSTLSTKTAAATTTTKTTTKTGEGVGRNDANPSDTADLMSETEGNDEEVENRAQEGLSAGEGKGDGRGSAATAAAPANSSSSTSSCTSSGSLGVVGANNKKETLDNLSLEEIENGNSERPSEQENIEVDDGEWDDGDKEEEESGGLAENMDTRGRRYTREDADPCDIDDMA